MRYVAFLCFIFAKTLSAGEVISLEGRHHLACYRGLETHVSPNFVPILRVRENLPDDLVGIPTFSRSGRLIATILPQQIRIHDLIQNKTVVSLSRAHGEIVVELTEQLIVLARPLMSESGLKYQAQVWSVEENPRLVGSHRVGSDAHTLWPAIRLSASGQDLMMWDAPLDQFQIVSLRTGQVLLRQRFQKMSVDSPAKDFFYSEGLNQLVVIKEAGVPQIISFSSAMAIQRSVPSAHIPLPRPMDAPPLPTRGQWAQLKLAAPLTTPDYQALIEQDERTYRPRYRGIGMSDDSRFVLIKGQAGPSAFWLQVVSTFRNQVVKMLRLPNDFFEVRTSPDSRLIAIGMRDRILIYSMETTDDERPLQAMGLFEESERFHPAHREFHFLSNHALVGHFGDHRVSQVELAIH